MLTAQIRMRVNALVIKRSRSTPRKSSPQLSGSLPYMCCRKCRQLSDCKTVSTSFASWRACGMVQSGKIPACTRASLRASSTTIKGCCRNQCISSSRSGADRIFASVSFFLLLAPDMATASRCKSWLPNTVTADLPSDLTSRKHSSDCGPRLTRSPVSHSTSLAGSNFTVASNCCSSR